MGVAGVLTMFVLGLAGSLHCVQMCGPLVLSFGLPAAGQGRRRQTLGHLAYHAGRLITYMALGALAGWAGAGVAVAGTLAGWQNTATVVGGVLMIGAALLVGMSLRARSSSQQSSGQNSLVQIGPASRFTRLAGRLLRVATLRGRFLTGLVMGLLPCGLIYAALLRALAAASPLGGAAAMGAFCLGATGPLLGLGVFSVAINRWMGLRGQGWAVAGFVLVGAVLIWRGLLPAELHQHHMHMAHYGYSR